MLYSPHMGLEPTFWEKPVEGVVDKNEYSKHNWVDMSDLIQKNDFFQFVFLQDGKVVIWDAFTTNKVMQMILD